MILRFLLLATPVALVLGFLFQSTQAKVEFVPALKNGGPPVAISTINGPIQPIMVSEQDERIAAIGQRLFFDPILSEGGALSCASCHSPEHWGADGGQTATGRDGRARDLNTPTVFNSAYNFRQFWDGRAESLEEQLDGPIHDPDEFDTTWPEILERLEMSEYLADFDATFRTGLSRDNVRRALATFQRTLVTPNSKFDRWLLGDETALDEQERRGYERFVQIGCASCHQGVNVGGNLFQPFGVMDDYFADKGDPRDSDLGRFNVTGREEDRYVFKVPGLRNVARTSPYFHDGSVADLSEAVSIMARYQLLEPLDEEGIADIVSFLETLTGERPAAMK